MDVVEALVRCGGVARTADVLRVVPRHELRRAVEQGRVVRAAHGRYRLPDYDAHAAAAAQLGGASSLLSAALAHGWPVKLPPERPQVVVPRGRNVGARRAGVELRWAEVSRAELDAGVTDPVRTVLDCARHLAFDVALAVADSALRDGVPLTDLLLACQRSPRSGRGRAFRVLEQASPLAANPFESVLRAVLIDVPGTHFEPQVWVGNVGRADLVDRSRRVVVEADSFEFHSDSASLARDMERYNGFVAEDHRVLRFAWRHAMFGQDYVRAVVSSVLTPDRRSVRVCPTCAVA
ncbi:type IV toxin-antitoxin system AbiEi family antitoxin domain-containing protein [Nocardioides aurantiacus]|uniref:Putative AbiEi antitoxin of type IV toxin-antitoxin system n=1 Tax=Nocardioides aurantiacus TaxID=86796 RepID=A0A3N2CY94_9ACTN|nr:type IV toxin-antitoxin system AbiEi family antitoxin domain-containing protein [Nocardioides aurantiacus]ROR92515.1 putative AbiEi antitoxin of type IV toxin-antitoxin system [Nocardioides aurantiacus]